MTFLYLAPQGAVDDEVLTIIETCLWANFGYEIRQLGSSAEPEYAFDLRRRQYSSTLILRQLVVKCPPDAARILAVTEKDLFIPMLSFIFGQAQLNGTVAIISLARLRQEFYGLPSNRMLLLARVVKEALHEMGHTFGLIHCPERTCPMSLSTNIHQVDTKGSEFCAGCRALLRENIGATYEQAANIMRAED
ncbi:MAG: archaemetzincin [Acidobacteriia bacterium]|nr:archaemetzincin [Terriglobia bacterium]